MKPIKIILKNQHFVVIDKPCEILSVPSRMGTADPRPVAGIMVQGLLSTKIFPVHRLDEAVSGLLIFALTAEAQRAGNRWFEHHEIVKTYAALTSADIPNEFMSHGPDTAWGTWTCKLAKGKKRAFIAPHGKDSVTHFRLIYRRSSEPSLWHLQPATGRSHQLRFEMAKHMMPIDGDKLYGSNVPSKSGMGIDLRSFHLDLSACKNREDFGMPHILEIP